MRSLKSPPSYDAFREFNRLSLSSEDISASSRDAAMETARQLTTSLAAFVRTRSPQTRQVEEPRQPPLTRHYLFNGRGRSKTVLSYFDPRSEESEVEKAIVA
jgi:hypothetical protein